jgi:protein O-mannosyl-transferase
MLTTPTRFQVGLTPSSVVTLLVACVLAAAVAYVPALKNAPVWDDADLTTQNPYVQSISGLARIVTTDIWSASAKEEPSSFYRPLAMISYLVNRLLFGNSATSYHAVNIGLHAVNAALLGGLAWRLTKQGHIAIALVPALWFAVAPVNVEAVAWIAGRFDLLGTGLVLAALTSNVDGSRRARTSAAAFVVQALFFWHWKTRSFCVAAFGTSDSNTQHALPALRSSSSSDFSLA